MKCPDCKKGELVLRTTMLDFAVGSDNMDACEVLVDCDPYYKCDACNTEFDPEDVEE